MNRRERLMERDRSDNAAGGIDDGGFEGGGQLTDIAGPGVPHEVLQCTRGKDCGRLLVAMADVLEDGLSERGDVFTAVAEGWQQEADGREAEGEIGQEAALIRKLAERRMGRGEEKETRGAREIALDRFDEAEQEMLAAGGQQVYAIEIECSVAGWKIGFSDEPFSGIMAAERGGGKRTFVVQQPGEEMFPGSGLALEGCQMKAGSDDFRLKKETTHGGVYADEIFGGHVAIGELPNG